MSDELLRRTLQAVEAPIRPSAAFVDDLHARLAADLGLDQQPTPVDRVRAPSRPQIRRHARVGWLAIAALLVLALLALILGPQGRTPDVSPAPATPAPSPQVVAAPTPVTSPDLAGIPSPIPSLDALHSDGLVVFELADVVEIPRLRVLRADLSSIELLPDVPGVQGRATWSPDGTRLAFTGYDPSVVDARPLIWETDLVGSDPRLLSEECDAPVCQAENEPAYSRDGTQLAFVRTRIPDDGGQPVAVIAIRDLPSGTVTELAATGRPRGETFILHPRWSPDGTTIAYSVSTIDEFGFADGSTIHLVGADGTNDRVLTAPELEAGDPEWTPDGNSVVFSSQPIRAYAAELNRHATAMHLYRIGSDGSGAQEFDLDGPVGAPSWAPRGDQILFTYLEGAGDNSPGHGRLFVMDPDGRNVLPVTSSLGTPGWYAVQQPVP